MKNRRWLRLGVFVALIAPLVLILPALDSHLRALSLWLRMQGSHSVFSRYRERAVSVQEQPLLKVYVPAGLGYPPAIVIIHGVHHLGMEEPRLQSFARAFSSNGVKVYTPELPELKEYAITPRSIERIGEAACSARSTEGRPVGLFGLSFSGGLALMAAADPRFADCIRYVIAVGAHDDMQRVARYYVTGHDLRPDGSEQALPAHEYGVLILIYSHIEDFFPAQDADGARRALRLQLYEQPQAALAEAARLDPAAREKVEKLLHHEYGFLSPELLQEIDRRKSEFDAVSPSHKLASLHVPVLLLHGYGDNVIPAAETEWLAGEVPRGMLRSELISRAVTHVETGGTPSVWEQLGLFHFVARMIEIARD